jgi:ribosomal protein S18 acetylase RimI-like enzyme
MTANVNGRNERVSDTRLSAEQLTQIELLADLCNHQDGIELKLNWEHMRTGSVWERNDFLYEQDGQIVGYLGLSAPNRREIEITGVVHPDYRRRGIFHYLYEQATEEIRSRQIPRVVFSVNHVGPSGQAFAKAQGARYSFTEYEMVLGTATPLEKGNPGLTVDYAATEDEVFVVDCMFTCFDVPEEESRETFLQAMTSINRQIYIVRLDGKPMGMIGAVFGGMAVKVQGLGILPAYRKQGYGRQAFAEAVHKLLGDGHPNIEFKVRCANTASLAMYQACGFEVATAYDYYEIAPTYGEDRGELE